MHTVIRNLSKILLKRIREVASSSNNCLTKQWMTRSYGNKPQEKKSPTDFTLKLLDDDSIESCYFKNGMRLVCECKDTFTTSIGCFLPAGAIHETQQERGSSLFLEHLLFRRTSSRTQEELERQIEEVGGKINTIAMRDMFVFYGTVPSECVDVLIQLFSDVILHGVTNDEDAAIEKSVVLQNLDTMESDREKTIMDYLPNAAYQGTPLAKSVYPETSIIKNFSTECLASFRSRLMKTHFITMISVGSLPLCDLQTMICQYFSTEVCEMMPRLEEEKHGYRFSGADFRLRDDNEKLGYVAVGVEGPSYSQMQDYVTLNVAQAFVGSWDRTCGGASYNAPYIAHCAFNSDLCHLYKSFYLNWRKASIWGCYFVADKMRLDDMISMVQREWLKVCTTITEKQIQRAVNQCKMNELLKVQNPIERLLDLIEQFSRGGNYEPISMKLSRYQAVTPDRMREVANKYIYNQSPVVVAIGRIENLPDYCCIEDKMYLLQY